MVTGLFHELDTMVGAHDGIEGGGCLARTERLVEAAGIEPCQAVITNPMMTHDFGFYVMKSSELPRRFESPGVLPSLGDIMETNSGQNRATLLSGARTSISTLALDRPLNSKYNVNDAGCTYGRSRTFGAGY